MRKRPGVARRLGRVWIAALLGLACGLPVVGVADAAGSPVNGSLPTIAGTAKDGHLLRASKGGWTGQAPIKYAYQWTRCDASGADCEDIATAARANRKVTAEDVGHTLRVAVTASNSTGSSSATSAPTGIVAPLGPAEKSLPKIAGVFEDGQLLSVSDGTWKGTPPLSFTYQWEACNRSGGSCSVISGATSSSYRAISSQIGGKLKVIVTASNAGGSASTVSKPTSRIEAGPPVSIALPTISGSLEEGQTLTANPGAWAGTAPFAFAYHWQRCSILGGSCEDIPGATSSTYSISVLDLASTLAVVVTVSNAQGSASATSAETDPILALLPSNTVLPAISGLLQDGQLLSVGTGSWSGTEPISYSYQWQLCNLLGEACSNISEATGSTLKLSPSDVGGTLDVVVTATNVAGSTSVTTPVTALIEGILPANTVLPTISGLLQDGQLLSVGTGSWSGTQPISYSYQWQLCNLLGEACSDISEATGSTLKLSPSDVGGTLDVVVTATNVAGSSSVTSSVTGLIEGLLPSNTVLPSISGVLKEGQLLSVGAGSWSGTEPISYSYQWQLCNAAGKSCADISEATGSSLKLALADVGGTLDVVVKATNVAGSSSVTSTVTGLIEGLLPSNTVLPSISGVLKEGQLLSVGTGSWSGTEPISYSYQWQLCNAAGKSCADISEATGSSLKLALADVGGTLDVVVKATNVAGSSSVTSTVTGLIEGLVPSNTALPSISGVLKEGQLLSVGTGTWTGSEPISYSYQWELCNAAGKSCADIPEATGSSLKLALADVGGTLDVVVKATNVAGSTSVTSTVTGLIEGLVPSNTALPSISGVLKEGQLLSVGTGSWSGTEPISYSYQWQLCNAAGKSCADISEATGSSLKLTIADIGSTLDVVVKATNVAGSSSVTSLVTGLIEGLVPSNTELPSISGVLQEGQLLSVGTGSWSGTEPISYSYQWQLCNSLRSGCSNITGATGTSFTPSVSDIGSTLAVVVKATNVAGSTSVTSTVTGLIAGVIPSNTALPTISGLLKEGALLSVGTGTWTGSEPISYSYQWQMCNLLGNSCSNIAGATGASLKLVLEDVGHTLTVMVKATNVAGSTTVSTPLTGLITGL
jgi:hypothetical protein